MKNNITEIVFILDASGSMHGLEMDTIGGFNSMIDKQKAEDGRAFVTTITFNTESKMIHDRANIQKITSLTERDYQTFGCTALYDTIGNAVTHIESIHKYARREDVPEKTLFVITTDGMENASSKYSKESLRALIEKKKNDGWEFLFLGANIDAQEEASKIGIQKERAVTFVNDSEGTQLNYNVMNEAVTSLRSQRVIRDDWAKPIMERK